MYKQNVRKYCMKRTIQEHLEKYGKSYLLLFIFIVIGVIIGIFGLNNSSQSSKEQIISYLNNKVVGIEKANISYLILLKNSIWKKIQFFIFLVFLCLSILGKYGAISLVIFKGFTIGYSVASSIMTFGVGKGILMSLSLTLLTEIMLIPTIFYTIITSLQMFNDCSYQNYESKRQLILKYIVKLLCIIIIIFLISLIETFINVNIFLLFRKLF